MLVLDKRHRVHVGGPLNDEDASARVTIEVRVLQDVEQVAALDVEVDALAPDAALFLSFRVFRVSQAKYFTTGRIRRRVPARHTLASA